MTQTMRERLIEAAAKASYEANDIRAPWEDAQEEWGEIYRKRAAAAVDAVLSELREPDEGMIRTGAKTANAIDPYCRWTGADSFTAMIDHLMAGK